jgi:hypothetical protein
MLLALGDGRHRFDVDYRLTRAGAEGLEREFRLSVR